ncbi:MAG: hypothetical protein AAF559_00325 [Pseudomonadota bacterium]
MTYVSLEPLSTEAQLALAHTKGETRSALTILFELDSRLARIVAATTEPMLGQMRLAWWREMLGKPVSDRPAGDQVLDAIGSVWQGREGFLVSVVDGWEHMLSDPPLTREAAIAFAEGRGAAFGGLASFSRRANAFRPQLEAAGRIWAIADAACHIGTEAERETLVALGRELPLPDALPAPFRGIAILAALGARALKAGGAPLMEGRGAGWTAFRAGLLGR